nr:transmembrane protein [Tanacetum cinerariifolium]
MDRHMVAGAALACGIAMTMDALHGFRYKKLWFPCKFFALNATILVLIAIAIKFSMDLNATMPHHQDQLAKKHLSVAEGLGRFRKVLDTGIFIWSSIRNRTLSTVHSLSSFRKSEESVQTARDSEILSGVPFGKGTP